MGNTLAIVIGNEFMLNPGDFRAASVFKAYARDMKAYMKMCNDDEASPSHGAMRQIPLMYAARDFGDKKDAEFMSYLMCESADVSIDIFGLNIERWCDPDATDAYDGIHKMVEAANLPGSFMFSEMGCPQNQVHKAPAGQTCRTLPTLGQCCPRNWNQVPDFFQKFKMFDGFSAYAYWNSGAPNFNMLDSNKDDAALFDDGKNFFSQVDKVGKAARPITQGHYPTCANTVNGQSVLPLSGIKAYNEDKYPASSCPSNSWYEARPVVGMWLAAQLMSEGDTALAMVARLD